MAGEAVRISRDWLRTPRTSALAWWIPHTALVVGLGIGLLQAVTQIQEQTLVFVPKIVAVFVVLLLALPFAGAAMSGLMTDIANRIAAY